MKSEVLDTLGGAATIVGGAGVCVSTVNVFAPVPGPAPAPPPSATTPPPALALTLPAASVAVALTVCGPSASAEDSASDQWPEPSALVVPTARPST